MLSAVIVALSKVIVFPPRAVAIKSSTSIAPDMLEFPVIVMLLQVSFVVAEIFWHSSCRLSAAKLSADRLPVIVILPAEVLFIFESSEKSPVRLKIPETVIFAPSSMVSLDVSPIVTVPLISGRFVTCGITMVSELDGAEPSNQLLGSNQFVSVAPVQTKVPAAAVVFAPVESSFIKLEETGVSVTISPSFVIDPAVPVMASAETIAPLSIIRFVSLFVVIVPSQLTLMPTSSAPV